MGTIASIIGLISLLIFGLSGDLRFDGLGAMSIAVVLVILSFLLLKAAKDLLIGRSASKETQDKITKAALQIPEVKEVLDLKTLYLGPEKLLINIEVHVKDNLTTDRIEELMDLIKSKITSQISSAHHIQVELETPNPMSLKTKKFSPK